MIDGLMLDDRKVGSGSAQDNDPAHKPHHLVVLYTTQRLGIHKSPRSLAGMRRKRLFVRMILVRWYAVAQLHTLKGVHTEVQRHPEHEEMMSFQRLLREQRLTQQEHKQK